MDQKNEYRITYLFLDSMNGVRYLYKGAWHPIEIGDTSGHIERVIQRGELWDVETR